MKQQLPMNAKPPAVIFDIDYTVFNTKTFRQNLFSLLAETVHYSGTTPFFTFAREIEQEVKKQEGYFDPVAFLTLLKQRTGTKQSVAELTDIFFDESLYVESLYENARDVFQELVMKRDIPILIFSKGAKKFQLLKLAALKEMIKQDNIHIFVDKLKQLKEFLITYDAYQLYLVDDLPTVLKEAKAFNAEIVTIWINRDPSLKESDFVSDFRADYVIENLQEISTIVTKKHVH